MSDEAVPDKGFARNLGGASGICTPKILQRQLHIAMGQTLSLVLGWLYESLFPTLEHEPTTSPSPSPQPLPDDVMDVVVAAPPALVDLNVAVPDHEGAAAAAAAAPAADAVMDVIPLPDDVMDVVVAAPPAQVDLNVAAPDHEGAAAAAAAAPAADAVMDVIPLSDDMMGVVFSLCDDRAQVMTLPEVSKQWRRISQQNAAKITVIDLTWAEAVSNAPFADHDRCAITDAGIARLVQRFPNLKHIDLSYCDNVTDGGLEAVAAGCPDLQHLGLRWCKKVTNGGLQAIAARCPKLQHLDLFGCENVTDGGLTAIRDGCPNLQYLNLDMCVFVTDAGAALFPNAEVNHNLVG